VAATYKVVLVGAGIMAGLRDDPRRVCRAVSHARGIALTRSLRLAGVYDPVFNRATKLCARWGGAPYHGLLDMLDEVRPDVVVIASSTGSHVSAATTVLQSSFAPRLLVLEKPPACTRDDWRTLVHVCDRIRTTRVIVNLTRRFDPRYRRLAGAIARGSYGQIADGVFTYYGGWFNNGIHAVDTLRLLLGDRLSVASSSMSASTVVDPSRTVVLAVRGTNARILLVPFDHGSFKLFELQLGFSGARLRIEDFGRRFTIERAKKTRDAGRTLGRPVAVFQHAAVSPIQNMYRMCAAALRGCEPPELDGVTLKGIAKTMEIMLDAA